MINKNVTLKTLTSITFFLLSLLTHAQDKFFTKTGTIQFYSNAALETIEAKNKTVTAVLDSKTGGLQFSVQMKGFEFEKALMQQHFNDTYVESDKYPKADFAGAITNNSSVNYKKDGSYKVTVKGKLTLHGQTKDVKAPGIITIAGGKVATASTFTINVSDYKISIPASTKNKVSNSIKITVDAKLDPYNG